MSALAGFTRLSHSVAVYIPSTYNVDGKATDELVGGFVRFVKRELAQRFGGFTALRAGAVEGGWVAESGDLVEESITIVKAFAAELTEEDIRFVIDMAARIKADMRQEAVSIEIDGELVLV